VAFNCKIFTPEHRSNAWRQTHMARQSQSKTGHAGTDLNSALFKKKNCLKRKKAYLTNIDPIIVPFWPHSRLAVILHTKVSALTPYITPTPTYPFLILAGTLKTYSVYSLRL